MFKIRFHNYIICQILDHTVEWTWLAILGYRNEMNQTSWKCGGSIISNMHVITSARCLSEESLNLVRLGEVDFFPENEGNAQDFYISGKYIHPSFRKNPLKNDIGIIKLREGISFDCKFFQ